MASSQKQMTVQAGNAQATVNATVNDSLPAVPCPGPGGFTYIGARYVPLFADPIDWNNQTTYEPLTIVMHEGNSYTSKRYVPTGIDISNGDYWVPTGNYNGQFQHLSDQVAKYLNDIQSNTDAIEKETQERENADNTFSAQINNLITSVGALSSDPPIFVSSTAEMTNNSKVYVLTTNGHVYAYNGTAFVDTGIDYGVANAVHYDTDVSGTPEPPYDNANTYPLNTVCTISAPQNVANLPSDTGGILITVGGGPQNYGTQLYNTYNNQMFFRYLRENSTATAWKEIGDYSQTVRFDRVVNSALGAPYDNANTYPLNTVCAISAPQNVANLPSDTGGILITVGGGANNYGTQLYNTYNNQMFFRYLRENSTATAWKEIGDYSQTVRFDRVVNSALGAPYDNANTYPLNTVCAISAPQNVANLPSDTGGILITVGGGANNYGTQIYNTYANNMYCRFLREESTASAWKKLGNEYGTISLFENIGIIGDSFASGYIHNNSGHVDAYNVSWPSIMGRMYGNKIDNYAKSGATAKTWLEDKLGAMQSGSADNLYIVALGLNDRAESFPIGSTSDMTDNPVDNPDTFYGNLDKIIYYIKQKSPSGKIVISGLDSSNEYDTAIYNVAEHNGIPYLNIKENDFFTSDFYKRKNNEGDHFHPNAVIYSGMAVAYAEMIAATFDSNFSYYADYMNGE